MIGLILKDFYTLRQYSKTMLFMLVFFALISLGLDNPATFFEGIYHHYVNDDVYLFFFL